MGQHRETGACSGAARRYHEGVPILDTAAHALSGTGGIDDHGRRHGCEQLLFGPTWQPLIHGEDGIAGLPGTFHSGYEGRPRLEIQRHKVVHCITVPDGLRVRGRTRKPATVTAGASTVP